MYIFFLADGPGRKALSTLFSEKNIYFNEAPYWPLGSNSSSAFNKISNILTDLYLDNFFIHQVQHHDVVGGRTDGCFTCFSEYENFAQNDQHVAERIYGIVMDYIGYLDGNVMIKTPFSDGQFVKCKLIGHLRHKSQEAVDRWTGYAQMFYAFDDTIIKKPFKFVANNYFTQNTHPIAFHYNFHIDPNCNIGVNRRQLEMIEKALDEHLYNPIREELFRRMKKDYIEQYVLPYHQFVTSREW